MEAKKPFSGSSLKGSSSFVAVGTRAFSSFYQKDAKEQKGVADNTLPSWVVHSFIFTHFRFLESVWQEMSFLSTCLSIVTGENPLISESIFAGEFFYFNWNFQSWNCWLCLSAVHSFSKCLLSLLRWWWKQWAVYWSLVEWNQGKDFFISKLGFFSQEKKYFCLRYFTTKTL